MKLIYRATGGQNNAKIIIKLKTFQPFMSV